MAFDRNAEADQAYGHKPVLLDECLEALAIRPDGVYLDGTLGRAGHSLEILRRLTAGGRLIGLDRDGTALEAARVRLAEYADRVTLVHSNFSRLAEVLDRADRAGTFLLDSVTALLANEMFAGGFDPRAPARAAEELAAFLDGVRNCVVVSDYIYADGADYGPRSEAFRRGLAALDRLLAERCGCVVEVCAGLPIVQKGRLPGADRK